MNPYGWILLATLALFMFSALLWIWGKLSLQRENEYEDLYKKTLNQVENMTVNSYNARRIELRIGQLESLRWKNKEKTAVLKESFYNKFGEYLKK